MPRRPKLLVVAASFALAALAIGPAYASGTASPATISVDCDLTNGVNSTVVTGLVGDSFTVDNSAASSGACLFAGTAGVVTASNLSGNSLAAGQSSVVSIIGAGVFTITPSSGIAGVISVVTGDPLGLPEYTITFDPDGGTCSGDQSVTGFGSGWYAMPSSDSCRKPFYTLTGWAPEPNATNGYFLPGAAGQFAEDETLYALWAPEGVEITFDANVGPEQRCVSASGDLVPPADQSRTIVWGAGEGLQLPGSAPCTPLGHALVGWAKSGDGPPLFAPGELDSTVGLSPGTAITLYAVWRPDFSVLLADSIGDIPGPSPCSPREVDVDIALNARPLDIFAVVAGSMTPIVVAEMKPAATATLTCPSGPNGTVPTVSVSVQWRGASPVQIEDLTLVNPSGMSSLQGESPESTASVRAFATFSPANPAWDAAEAAQRAPESISIDVNGSVYYNVGMGEARLGLSGQGQSPLS